MLQGDTQLNGDNVGFLDGRGILDQRCFRISGNRVEKELVEHGGAILCCCLYRDGTPAVFLATAQKLTAFCCR